jgi:hypothetical protein
LGKKRKEKTLLVGNAAKTVMSESLANFSIVRKYKIKSVTQPKLFSWRERGTSPAFSFTITNH